MDRTPVGSPFQLVPVIDLRHGLVVRARAGERDSYAPIETPLAKGSDPVAVALGLLGAVSAAALYVADLDAIIDRVPPDLPNLRRIADACEGIPVWVDAGFSEWDGAEDFLHARLGRPVIGSESQGDTALLRRLGHRAILSLDTRGTERLGPEELHGDARCWPRDVIVMTLGRIGTGSGPDLTRIAGLAAANPATRLYAAGGVRGPDDIAALRRAGATGALVASAIHDGHLT